MRPVGFTKAGQPVLYSCNALASDRSYKGNREHMIQSFEQAIRLMPPSVERWVWFADLTGFSVRDLSPVRCLAARATASAAPCCGQIVLDPFLVCRVACCVRSAHNDTL